MGLSPLSTSVFQGLLTDDPDARKIAAMRELAVLSVRHARRHGAALGEPIVSAAVAIRTAHPQQDDYILQAIRACDVSRAHNLFPPAIHPEMLGYDVKKLPEETPLQRVEKLFALIVMEAKFKSGRPTFDAIETVRAILLDPAHEFPAPRIHLSPKDEQIVQTLQALRGMSMLPSLANAPMPLAEKEPVLALV